MAALSYDGHESAVGRVHPGVGLGRVGSGPIVWVRLDDICANKI